MDELKKRMAPPEFSGLFGRERQKQLLASAIANNRLAHSYLFSGPQGSGKLAMAIELARYHLCQDEKTKPCGRCSACKQMQLLRHPNVFVLFAHPKSLKEQERADIIASIAEQPYYFRSRWANPSILIDDVRQLRRDLNLRSAHGRNRVVLIIEAQQMNPEASNALLKLLEEPPADTYFLLTSSAPEFIVPTVLSRCQQLQFFLFSREEIEAGLQKMTALDKKDRHLIARMANGSMRRALELTDENVEELRAEAVELLRAAVKAPSRTAAHAAALCDARDRKTLKEIFELLEMWIRDAMLVHALGAEQAEPHVHNLDDLATLQKFVENYPEFRFAEAVNEIDTSIHLLDRNAQPLLVTIVMLNRLKAFSRRVEFSNAA